MPPLSRSRITERRLLIVEGKDDELFFSAFVDHLGITGLQTLGVGGKTQLGRNLKSPPPGFSGLISLGIIRDANSDARGAFRSVCDALKSAGLAAPPAVGEPAGTNPRVNVLILPDGRNPGTLEDVCLRSVRSDPVLPCLNQFFHCIENTTALPKQLSKARVHAFLSSRDTPDLRLGEAAQKGYWPLDDSAFNVIRDFLATLSSFE